MLDLTALWAKAVVSSLVPPREACWPLRLRRQVLKTAVGFMPLAAALLLIAGTCLAQRAPAPLTVIHDAGRTVSIAPYLQVLQVGALRATAHSAPRPANVQPAWSFPVKTLAMAPGRLRSPMTVPLKEALPNAIFLVGSDPLSQHWLARNRARLRQIGAMGMLVEVATIEGFRQMQSLAGGLPLAPASAEELAKGLKLALYPILIDTNGMVSQ